MNIMPSIHRTVMTAISRQPPLPLMILKIQSIERRAPLVLLPNHHSPPVHVFSVGKKWNHGLFRHETSNITRNRNPKPHNSTQIQQSDFTHLQSNGLYPFTCCGYNKRRVWRHQSTTLIPRFGSVKWKRSDGEGQPLQRSRTPYKSLHFPSPL